MLGRCADTIKTITVRANGITVDLGGIEDCSQLETFNLSSSYAPLVNINSISGCTSLQKASFDEQGPGRPQTYPYTAAFITAIRDLPQLHTLDLDFQEISTNSPAWQQLRQADALRHLNFWKFSVHDSPLAAHNITSLTVYSVHTIPERAPRRGCITKALPKLQELTVQSARSCFQADDISGPLNAAGPALAGHEVLRKLVLGWTGGSTGLFWSSADDIPNLEVLEQREVPSESLQQVLQQAAGCEQLHELRLNYTPQTPMHQGSNPVPPVSQEGLSTLAEGACWGSLRSADLLADFEFAKSFANSPAGQKRPKGTPMTAVASFLAEELPGLEMLRIDVRLGQGAGVQQQAAGAQQQTAAMTAPQVAAALQDEFRSQGLQGVRGFEVDSEDEWPLKWPDVSRCTPVRGRVGRCMVRCRVWA